MKFTQRLSLRVRLTLIFLILASVTWLLSSFVAWKQTTDNVDELFDTQLMLFAKRLSTLDLNEINAADRMAQTPNKLKHGHVDDDALTFAIFSNGFGRLSGARKLKRNGLSTCAGAISSIRSSILMRLWACFALVALARKRSI